MKQVNEYTLELEDVKLDDEEVTEQVIEKVKSVVGENAMLELDKKFHTYKEAEEEFKSVYEPIKARLLTLMETDPEVREKVKVFLCGNTKLTYISPSTRSTVDSKKLKEELPDVAKMYEKTTDVKASLRIEEVD